MRCADSKETGLTHHSRTFTAYWPQRNNYCLCYNERTKTEDEMTYRGNLALHRMPKREGRVLLTFRSRLSSPSVELMLSYSLVLEGLCRLFFTES